MHLAAAAGGIRETHLIRSWRYLFRQLFYIYYISIMTHMDYVQSSYIRPRQFHHAFSVRVCGSYSV